MHCSNCGQSLPEGAMVCPSCGAPVPSAAQPTPAAPSAPFSPGFAPSPQFAAAPSPPAGSGMATASLILGVLAILCILLTAFLAYGLGTNILRELGSEFTTEEAQRLATDPAFQSTAIGVLAAFAFSELLGLSGLILGIIGVSQESKRPTRSGKVLGIAGIVVSLVPLLCCVASLLIYATSALGS